MDSLTRAEHRGVLAAHVLPKLSLLALQAFAQSCSDFRRLVHIELQPPIWRCCTLLHAYQSACYLCHARQDTSVHCKHEKKRLLNCIGHFLMSTANKLSRSLQGIHQTQGSIDSCQAETMQTCVTLQAVSNLQLT